MKARPGTVAVTSVLGLLLGTALGAAGGALATDREVENVGEIPIRLTEISGLVVDVDGRVVERGCRIRTWKRPDTALIDGVTYRAQHLADGRIEVAATFPGGSVSYSIYGDRETFASVWPSLEPAPAPADTRDEVVETSFVIPFVVLAEPSNALVPFGVAVGSVDALLRAQLGLADDEGVPVTEVLEGSTAAALGVARFDVIVAVNGLRVGTGEQVAGLWAETAPGQAIRLVVIRGGRPLVLSGERPRA